MIIEDAREQTRAAIEFLERSKDEMDSPEAQFWTVPEFLAHAEESKLTLKEKEVLVDQAILLLDQFYAHLPFKRARYAVDPVQRLRLIRSQIRDHSDLAFHKEMVYVFTRLRDAHTFYGLPRPFRGAFAFLPFRMQCFHDNTDNTGRRRFLVTSVMDGFKHPRFEPHAEITYWNGMPVERAVEREAGFDPLGNEAARFVRGLNKMSSRSLAFAVPPEEDWVFLQYLPKNDTEPEDELGILLPWYIATGCLKPVWRDGPATSVNESTLETAQARKFLWHRGVLAKEKAMNTAYGPAQALTPGAGAAASSPEAQAQPDLSRDSKFPSLFEFQHSGGVADAGDIDPAALRDPDHPDKRFGCVRIRSFDHSSADQFVDEFGRILDILQAAAPDGLIVDVRSNPGGAIDAAERALGLLTPEAVQPSTFHFLNTRLTQQIAEAINTGASGVALGPNQAEWKPWAKDLIASVFNGGVMTSGRTLTKFEFIADSGQRYQGPVTLIIDALSYSATDLFAAGFQDNEAGAIIGVDENSGGGGANRWLHEEMRAKLKGLSCVPLEELPGGAQLGLAIRRSSRAGRNAGAVIEDVGVHRDIAYRITKDDLLYRDRDLLRFGCTHLGARPRHALRIVSASRVENAISVELELHDLFRLEFLVNGLPQCSYAATDQQPFLVTTRSLEDDNDLLLRVNGYALEKPFPPDASDDSLPILRLVVSDVLQMASRKVTAAAMAK